MSRASKASQTTHRILIVVMLMVGAISAAADGGRRAMVSGSVVDPSGAAIVGAEIDLIGDRESIVAHTTTDDRGRFAFSESGQSAKYELKVSASGFQTLEQPLVANRELHIQLAIAAVRYDVEVGPGRNQVSAETSENKNVTELEGSALDKLPVLDQDYVTFMSAFLDSDLLGTSGASIVNGVEANSAGVSASAIKSIKINNNPYSALFAKPGRARLEITTKGGSEKFHGMLNFLFRDSRFDAVPAFAATKPQDQRRYFEGSITGPIGAGKHTTFLASVDHDETDDVAIVNATTLAGLVRENVNTPMRHTFVSGRLFHDWGQGNEFWIGYSFDHRTDENLNVGGLVLPEAGAHDAENEHEISFQYTRVISPKWLNQLRGIVGHNDHPTISNSDATAIRVLGAFTGGGAQADAKRTEAHLEFNDIVTYSSGRHEVKFGIDSPDISRRGEDDFSNQAGTYTFASLAAFQAGVPQTLLLQRGDGHLVFLEANFAGLVEDTFRMRTNFTLTTGLRYYYQNFFHNDANNVAPRLGFAWKPAREGKTVVRGGAGVFYDRTGPRAIADLLRFDGMRLRQFLIDSPQYPSLRDTNGLPIDLVRLGAKQSIPYTIQWSAGIERQLGKSAVLTRSG